MDAEVKIPRRRGRRIDSALNKLMKNVNELSPEVAVKVLATAIAWEKVKAKIAETESDFDPDNL